LGATLGIWLSSISAWPSGQFFSIQRTGGIT
jgi:hypothetical protein